MKDEPMLDNPMAYTAKLGVYMYHVSIAIYECRGDTRVLVNVRK